MKLAVLVGQAYSGDAGISCLVFSCIEKGLIHCRNLFGFEPDTFREGEDNEISTYRWAYEGKNDYLITPELVNIAKKLYFDYEGDVFAFDLMEVEEGVPFIHWIDG